MTNKPADKRSTSWVATHPVDAVWLALATGSVLQLAGSYYEHPLPAEVGTVLGYGWACMGVLAGLWVLSAFVPVLRWSWRLAPWPLSAWLGVPRWVDPLLALEALGISVRPSDPRVSAVRVRKHRRAGRVEALVPARFAPQWDETDWVERARRSQPVWNAAHSTVTRAGSSWFICWHSAPQTDSLEGTRMSSLSESGWVQ